MHEFGFMRKTGGRRTVSWMFFSVALAALVAQVQDTRLKIRPAESNGWVRLNSAATSNTLVILEASSNLLAWQTIATLHDGLFDYPDAGAGNFRQRFYRFSSRTRVETNDWKN